MTSDAMKRTRRRTSKRPKNREKKKKILLLFPTSSAVIHASSSKSDKAEKGAVFAPVDESGRIEKLLENSTATDETGCYSCTYFCAYVGFTCRPLLLLVLLADLKCRLTAPDRLLCTAHSLHGGVEAINITDTSRWCRHPC